MKELNNAARQVRADHRRVLPGTLFGLSAMRANVTSKDVSNWLGTTDQNPDPLVGLSGFAANPAPVAQMTTVGAGPTADHNHSIVSASIEIETPVSASVFDFWLDTLIALKGPDILRIKGIVHLESMELPFVFHGVQHIFDPPVLLESWNGSGTTSRVVVIARNMKEDELKASLNTLHLQPKEATSTVGGMMAHTAEVSV